MNPDTTAYTGECPTHRGQPLDFFCNDHFALCCSECRKKGGSHAKCNVVSYGSVDLRVMQAYLPKVAKKLERELCKADGACVKGLSERQAELERNIAQTKEAINAYFRALEAQRAQLIAELDRVLEENDFSALISELRAASANGTSVLVAGKRAVAEWDTTNGKEMVQRTSDVLFEARALAAMTKRAESAMKSPVCVSFSPSAPEPSLGKVVCGKATTAADPKETLKKSANGPKHDANEIKTTSSQTTRPQKGNSKVSEKSRASRSPSKAQKKSPASESKTSRKVSDRSRHGIVSRGAGTLEIFDVPNNSVFVSNLPFEIDDSLAREVFSGSEVSSVRLIEDDSGADGSCECAAPPTKSAVVTLSADYGVELFVDEYEGCIVNDYELETATIPDNSVLLSGTFADSLAETFCEMFHGVGFATFPGAHAVLSFGSSEAALDMLKCASEMSVEYKDIEVVPAPINIVENDDDDDDDGEVMMNNSVVVKNVPSVISADEVRSIFEGADVVSVDADKEGGGEDGLLLDWVVTLGPDTDIQEVLRGFEDIIIVRSD